MACQFTRRNIETKNHSKYLSGAVIKGLRWCRGMDE